MPRVTDLTINRVSLNLLPNSSKRDLRKRQGQILYMLFLLSREITEAENDVSQRRRIFYVVKQIHPLKVPVTDGMHAIFYPKSWN